MGGVGMRGVGMGGVVNTILNYTPYDHSFDMHVATELLRNRKKRISCGRGGRLEGVGDKKKLYCNFN